jgi:hypothetical protein
VLRAVIFSNSRGERREERGERREERGERREERGERREERGDKSRLNCKAKRLIRLAPES